MATLEGNKIKDTFKALLKVNNNGELNETLQEVTDGDGNGSGILINTSGDLRAEGTLEFGNLKDTAENITISKLVDQADGIANNDNDTSIPTSAAVKDYVDTNVTAQDLDFTGDSGTGAVDLDSQTLNLVGTNGVVTTASGQTITIDTSSLDSRLTTAEADIDTNTADIATEEAARIAADSVLQTNIDSEEAARIAADNTLQSNIDAEAATRLANDNSEAATRLANDNTLQDNIDAEQAARTSADSTLQSNIDAEASARASADTTEAATRLANDNTLQANIDSEASTRATADTTLQSNINAEAATRLANDNTLQANIDSEEAARIAADTTLQSNIDSEESARIAGDAVLQGQIDTNDTDISNLQSSKQDISEKGQANGYAPLDSGAKIPIANLPDSVVGQVEYQGTWNASTDTPSLPAATGVKGHYYVVATAGTYETISYAIGDWVISNGTAWEKVDNTDAVTTVFGRLGAIVANESDYSAYYPLIADLTAEESARIAADNTLQTNIDTEASTRASADTTLQGNIDTEETARIAGDANLQSQIDTINLDNVDGTGTANYIAKWTDGDTIGNSVIYDNGTNVGIGTGVPTEKIQVVGNGLFTGNVGLGVAPLTAIGNKRLTIYEASSTSLVLSNSNNFVNIFNGSTVGDPTSIFSNTGFKFATASDASATGFSEKMRITSTGNVGIGTSNPDSLLHLKGSTSKITLEDSDIAGATCIIQGGGAGNLTIAADPNNAVASSYITLQVDAAERMRINNAGNVGIGTSSPATGLVVETSSYTYSGTNYDIYGLFGKDGGGVRLGQDSNTQDSVIGTIGANDMLFVTYNGSSWGERMRITSSGNVGIGTSSPSGNLHVNGTGVVSLIAQSSGSDAVVRLINTTASTGKNYYISSTNVGNLSFVSVTDGERMRITSGGQVFFGTTTAAATAGIVITPNNSSGAATMFFNRNATTSTSYIQDFRNGGATVGFIAYNNSSVTYATSSDYRLKEDWQPMANALDRVEALKPINFAWKADGSRVDGFLAHELAEVIPEAVTGEKDATEEYEIPAVLDEEGNVIEEATTGVRNVYQGIDQSKIVPLLVAAMQEQQVMINDLKTRIQTLENK